MNKRCWTILVYKKIGAHLTVHSKASWPTRWSQSSHSSNPISSCLSTANQILTMRIAVVYSQASTIGWSLIRRFTGRGSCFGDGSACSNFCHSSVSGRKEISSLGSMSVASWFRFSTYSIWLSCLSLTFRHKTTKRVHLWNNFRWMVPYLLSTS